jgi:hypothetical protein
MSFFKRTLGLLTPLLLGASLAEAARFDALEYRNVGPTRGGRVTAVAGTVQEPGTFYLGASGGGVWKTTDYGTRWGNVSDGYFASPSIGDIAVSQSDPNVLYVGTGSDGLRSNVIRGKGVYGSRDGGRSWELSSGCARRATSAPWKSIRAATTRCGSRPSARPSRRTRARRLSHRDGGQSWDKVLEVSDEVGLLRPRAAAGQSRRGLRHGLEGASQALDHHQRRRAGRGRPVTSPRTAVRAGAASARACPTGLIGKIDLAVSPADSSVVYALVEAPGDEGGLYRSDDQGETFRQVSSKKRPPHAPLLLRQRRGRPDGPGHGLRPWRRATTAPDGGENWEQL